MYSLAQSGARSGFRARAVDLNGRPLSAAVALPYEAGFGPVVAAPEARGRGWLYAIGGEG